MKKRNLKERITLDPIMTLLVLIVLTIVISGFLSLLGVQVTYNSITDSVSFNYTQSLLSVESLFSLSGLKYIFTTTVSNFVSFTPLSSLIIILIGIFKSIFRQCFKRDTHCSSEILSIIYIIISTASCI